MLRTLTCIEGQHDPGLLALAVLICCLGAVSFSLLMRRTRECSRRRTEWWSLLAAIAAGTGVWATHFLSILAYETTVPMAFDGPLIIVSIIVGISMFWIALHVLGTAPTPMSSLCAAALATAGVATIHFIGMESTLVPARITYDGSLVAGGIFFSFAFSALSFLSFMRVGPNTQLIVPPIFSSLSVVALHFSSMAAIEYLPDGSQGYSLTAVSRDWLIVAVASGSFALIAIGAIGALVDRYLTDLRGFADATLEGIAIVRDGLVVEVNQQFAMIVGVAPTELLMTNANDWFRMNDGQCLGVERAAPGEGRLTHDRLNRVFEISTRSVEFRGRESMVLAVRDLTETKQALKKIEYLARHDSLTGLPNRSKMDELIEEAVKTPHAPFALFTLDLDRFKAVNDVFGHAAGDEILCKVARILKDCCSTDALIARMGGDEFMIMLPSQNPSLDARRLAREILNRFEEQMNPALDPMAVGTSIGVALFPKDATKAVALRAAADVALYRAKDKGKGQSCFFDEDMDTALRTRRTLEQELRAAMGRDQLRLVYQPQVDTGTGQVLGYEALLRWEHPDLGSVPPDTFIPVAEEIGQIIDIGIWVINEACREASHWSSELTVAVNVSPIQFHSSNLVETVENALRANRLSPERLEIEITESVLMDDRPFALATLRLLKGLGVKVAIDDFGTGYSSLGNLMNFPFDKIKIDKSFVAALDQDEAARSIIRAILGLGKNLSLPVVAEGVETDLQHRLIFEEGCAQAQGYLFGEPGEGLSGETEDERALRLRSA